MKNLQSFGIQELDAKEVFEIKGGRILGGGTVWGLIMSFAWSTVEDWEGNKKAFNDARNAALGN